jgi:hypothetical protein
VFKLLFQVSEKDIDRKTIVLQLFDHDKFSKNDAIGEVIMSSLTVNYNKSIPTKLSRNKEKNSLYNSLVCKKINIQSICIGSDITVDKELEHSD